MEWGKQDYVNYNWGCYAQGDAKAAGSYDYKASWNGAVNKCLGTTYCPSASALRPASTWGKQDYEDFVWACFAKGDSAAAGSYDYHTSWNNAVNTCLASKC